MLWGNVAGDSEGEGDRGVKLRKEKKRFVFGLLEGGGNKIIRINEETRE